jgi:site-specific DNA recombinase
MEKTITSVALLVRKSREEETEDVLLRQQAVLVDLCKRNGWKYEIFKEVASSQEYLERPELQAMLEKVKSFHYDAIVCADLDRLARHTVHFGLIKEILVNAGCLVVTPSKTYDFSVQEDDLFSDIQSVLAKNEYMTIKKRLNRGTRQSARDGSYMGKVRPCGYSYNPKTKRLELSQDAPIIKRMFEEYLNGLSTVDIAHKFTTEPVITSTNMIWTPSGISRMLNNICYAGHSLYGKTKVVGGKRGVKTNKEEWILIEDTHDAIIDKETWDKVQKLKRERTSRPISLQLGKHKFSGLIQCKLCGRIHSFQTSKGGKKRMNSCQTRHYINPNSLDNYTLCENKGGNVSQFELLFFIKFSQYINELENYIELIKSSNKPKKDTSEDRLKVLETQIKKNQQEIKRVQQGFIMEIFTESEAHDQIKVLKSRGESLEQELEQVKESSSNTGMDYLEQILDKMKKFMLGQSDMPESVANEKLREFVDVIVYYKVGEQNAEMDLDVKWNFNIE